MWPCRVSLTMKESFWASRCTLEASLSLSFSRMAQMSGSTSSLGKHLKITNMAEMSRASEYGSQVAHINVAKLSTTRSGQPCGSQAVRSRACADDPGRVGNILIYEVDSIQSWQAPFGTQVFAVEDQCNLFWYQDRYGSQQLGIRRAFQIRYVFEIAVRPDLGRCGDVAIVWRIHL